MAFAQDEEDHFVLKEIEKIVRERWRFIERTTRYGWLAAFSQRPSISPADATILSAFANKIGYENCELACQRIRKACRDLHPHCIPKIAIAILDEMYTLVILRKRGRESKCPNAQIIESTPTVFTISSAIF